MKLAPYLLLALMAGALLPLQAGVNGALRGVIGGPVQAALVSFAVGTTALLLFLVATRAPLPSPQAGGAWWMWTLGGVMGAIYVSLIVWLTPVLGPALAFGLIVAGQMGMALLLDHQGWLGFARHAVNGWRVLGAALIVGGVVLIRRF